MIYQPLSKITRSTELRLAAGASISNEGACLSGDFTGGVFGAKTSGAAAEEFLGFALTRTSAHPFALASIVEVETLTAVADVVTVSRTPVANTTRANNASTGASMTVSDVTGKAVTVTSGGTLSIRVTYRTLVSAAEAEMIQGNIVPGGYAGNKFGLVGVAQSGVIYTDQFDTAVNWGANPAIQLGAAGILTTSGSGTTIDGYVVHAPTAEYPFLGIAFSVAG